MTFLEFKNLGDGAKECISLKHAIPVATRHEGDCKYILYQLFSFYIEAQVTLTYSEITQYRAFENTEYLDPYLEEVSLADLRLR